MLQSCVLLKCLLPKHLAELPAPMEAPAEWEALWQQNPTAWASLVARMVKVAGEDPTAAAGALEFAGLALPNDEAASSDEEWICWDCGRDFRSRNALAAHRKAAHGRVHPCRPKLASTTCPGCDTDYFMMGRLLAHLDL